jgi:hypothetical protein
VSFPNVPKILSPDWVRRIADAVNYLLNRKSYLNIFADGLPSAGQQLLRTKFSERLVIAAVSSIGDAGVAATASATFTLQVNGSSIGTIVFGAGQTTATISLTSTEIPSLSVFEVIAPSPADATLADVTISLAVVR